MRMERYVPETEHWCRKVWNSGDMKFGLLMHWVLQFQWGDCGIHGALS